MARKLKNAVVGLHFGGEFPAIYRDHPDVGQVFLCDQDESLLAAYGQHFGYENCYADFDSLLASDVDAIHLVTGIPSHQELTVKALQAGKHCACTVPMATTLQGLTEIIQAQRSSGKNYMMMETSVYTFQSLYVRSMIAQGLIGNIQYMRGGTKVMIPDFSALVDTLSDALPDTLSDALSEAVSETPSDSPAGNP